MTRDAALAWIRGHETNSNEQAAQALLALLDDEVCELRDYYRKERDELVAALRPFAEAQGVADLRSARAASDYLAASDHIRPSAFRIARDVVVVIDSRKGQR